MKIFISVDIEGVAGINEPLQGQRGNPEYETARRLMTQEANAAVRGAFEGGATDVVVADSHGPMRNILADDLDPRAQLVSGKPRALSMIEGVCADCSGVILIGYHAAAGEIGVLAHTISGLAFAEIRINGEITGEPTLFAGHAAEIGVPLLAASGDDRLCAEIERQFPGACRIQVKTALGAQASQSLSPKASRNLIEAQVADAVRNSRTTKADLPCKPPLEIDIRLMRQVYADAADLLPHITRKSATQITFSASSHAKAISTIAALALMASAL